MSLFANSVAGFFFRHQLKPEPPWPSSHDRTTSANHHKLRLRSRLCAGFSATTWLLPHSSVTSLSSSSCSSRSSAATIADSHRDSSFFGVERPILGIHSSLCLAPSKPASPDSGFAVGIEVKRSSNGDFPLLQKKSLNFCFLQRDSDFQYVQKYPID